jgi:hypothetical protein
MYNYAFYAYLFYRGFQVSSSIENALGFMSFIKSITGVFSNLKKLTNWSSIESEQENSELGWVLIFIEGEKTEI